MLALYVMYLPKPQKAGAPRHAKIEAESIVTNPYLNPEMYHDEDAFMVIAHELGFR
jgi:hypothetical protein